MARGEGGGKRASGPSAALAPSCRRSASNSAPTVNNS